MLTYELDKVELRVIDNGVGADGLHEGFGMRGLRERFEPLGGHSSIETKQGRGLVLQITVPA